jgi:hypothetical protein
MIQCNSERSVKLAMAWSQGDSESECEVGVRLNPVQFLREYEVGEKWVWVGVRLYPVQVILDRYASEEYGRNLISKLRWIPIAGFSNLPIYVEGSGANHAGQTTSDGEDVLPQRGWFVLGSMGM